MTLWKPLRLIGLGRLLISYAVVDAAIVGVMAGFVLP